MTPDFDAEASRLVGYSCTKEEVAASLRAAFAAGQASKTPPKGHILTDDGVVRRVLGEFTMTEDGCIVAGDVPVYCENIRGHIIEYDVGTLDNQIPSGVFWSTRELAQAALAKGGEGKP